MNQVTPAQVAQTVADVKSFDPGLGSYSFKDLGEVVKFSDLMSKAGEMLPQHLQNKPALCMAVTMRATHWGFDPFALAGETYQAKGGGVIGYQAKVFSAALINASVKLRYRYEGEYKILNEPVQSAKGNVVCPRSAKGNRKCIAYVKVDGEVLEYETPELDNITIKNSPQWHLDPDQQLSYYAARGWARRYRSDVIMGAYSNDEVESMPAPKDVTPKTDAFAEMANKARQPEQEQQVQEEQTAPAEEIEDAEILPDEELPNFDPKIVEAGAQACRDGFGRADCPHRDDADKAAAWLAGWDAASEEDE